MRHANKVDGSDTHNSNNMDSNDAATSKLGRWRDPRHPDPWIARTNKFLLRFIKINDAQIQMTKDAYMEGDPLADELISWMHEAGMRKSWPQFELALTKGLPTVDSPSPSLTAFFSVLETPPAWMDHAAMRRGCDVAMRTSKMGEIVGFSGLLGGYAAVGLAKPLVATRGLDKATKLRLIETMQWVYDVYSSDGLGRFSPGFISTVRVRVLHALVRHKLVAQGWNCKRWGLPINQVDMGVTLHGQGVINLMAMRAMGAIITPSEGRDYFMLWRYIGHIMGVAPKFNPSSEWEAIKLIPLLMGTQEGPDEDSRHLAKALLETRREIWPEGKVGRLLADCDVNLRVALTRVLAGKAAGDGLGLPDHLLWQLVVYMIPAANIAQDLVRIMTPGATDRATRRGYEQFRQIMERLSEGKRTDFSHHHAK